MTLESFSDNESKKTAVRKFLTEVIPLPENLGHFEQMGETLDDMTGEEWSVVVPLVVAFQDGTISRESIAQAQTMAQMRAEEKFGKAGGIAALMNIPKTAFGAIVGYIANKASVVIIRRERRAKGI